MLWGHQRKGPECTVCHPWKLHITASAAHLLPLGWSWSSKSFSLISSALLSRGLRHPVLPFMLNKNDPANQFLTKRKAGAYRTEESDFLLYLLPLFFFLLYATWESGPGLYSSSLHAPHCVWDIVLGILYSTSIWINAKEHHQPMEVTGDFGLVTFLNNKLMGWSALLGNHSW